MNHEPHEPHENILYYTLTWFVLLSVNWINYLRHNLWKQKKLKVLNNCYCSTFNLTPVVLACTYTALIAPGSFASNLPSNIPVQNQLS